MISAVSLEGLFLTGFVPGVLIMAGMCAYAYVWAKRNPGFKQGPDHPVVCVSYADATAYARWRSDHTGRAYRLPTEAEWEYAARRDAPDAVEINPGAKGICRQANVADRALQRARGAPLKAGLCDDGSAYTAAVGTVAEDAQGLHHMLGNVWEWTCSGYDALYEGAEQRCTRPGTTTHRVMRGGSWSDPPGDVRPANRGRLPADHRFANLGFRVAIDPN